MHHTHRLHDETLELLPERAIFWPRKRMLLIADIHFGKAATFRARGVPVPHGTTRDNLACLSQLIARWQPQRIVFLGDFLHAREAHAPQTLRALRLWREQHAQLTLTLVRGNHDAKAGDPPLDLAIDVVDEPYVVDPFALCHHPDASVHGYVLAGHIHPGYHLHGRASDSVTLPCFHFGAAVGVLPAFGAFTGTWRVQAQDGDQIYLVGDGRVHALP